MKRIVLTFSIFIYSCNIATGKIYNIINDANGMNPIQAKMSNLIDISDAIVEVRPSLLHRFSPKETSVIGGSLIFNN
jgi:hypothetical protein